MGVEKLKLAIFISGRGSNMLSILEACKSPNFPAEIVLVLSNRPDAKGLALAENLDIPTECVDHKTFDTREFFELEISSRLKNYDIDFIILAGFMRIFTASFVAQWPKKILNIHPSLLPAYKGLNTHQRAIDDGQPEAGCSVHFVTPDLDSGPVILQKRVPILPNDTSESLSKRVLEQEHLAYAEAIQIVASSAS